MRLRSRGARKMKLCNIYNSAAHYRREIFLRMQDEFDCTFAVGEKPIGGKDIKSIDPADFRNFPGYLKNVRLFGNWYWQRGALKFLFRDFDTYVVLGEPFCVSTWAFCLLAKFFPRKRVFFWTHGWYGRENFIKRVLKKIFFRLADGGVFLYGNYARELMIKEGFDPKKLFTIHNSLAYGKQLALRKNIAPTDVFPAHFGNADKTLIFVGRLTETKRLDLILRAMAELRERGENYNLALVGDGSARAALEKLCGELGLSARVWFYGACYDEARLAELIYNADLCVSPGNIGLTAMHALMFGCPCVTHNAFPWQGPEFEAIVPEKTGAFFERGNAHALSDAVSKWFGTPRSREEIRDACYAEIDDSWNPDYQIRVMKTAFHSAEKTHE